MAICILPNKTNMTDETSLMPLDVKKHLMKKAIDNPEEIYATIKEAEDWLKELKNIARKSLNSKVPEEAKTHDIDTPNNIIHITRNRGKFKPDTVHALLVALKIPTDNIVGIKPITYAVKAGAFEVLEQYLKDGILTKAQFDTMFEEGNFTVKVKPKSDLTIALNSRNGD